MMDAHFDVLLFGGGGRMGRQLFRIVTEAGHRCLEIDARQDPDVARALEAHLAQAAVVIDFSSPEGTLLLLDHLLRHPVPCVIGTTGLTPAHHAMMDQLAKRTPVIDSSNFSVGMNVLWLLTERAAGVLDPESFDVEIVEAHHRNKKDAPSGSAATLVERVRAGRARSPMDETLFHGPGVTAGRPPGAIGVAAVRGGDVVGEHTVFFLGDGERIELSHRATDRVILARGAWRAARWLHGRDPGRYGMKDVLGL